VGYRVAIQDSSRPDAATIAAQLSRSGPGRRRNPREPRSGQVIVLSVISIVVLLGFVALATDLGLFWSKRRQMQTAADAAAVAAAAALRSGKTSPTTAASSVAGLNGFTSGTSGVTLTVNNPPLSGAYAGNANYVEVVIAQPEPTYFLRVLGYTSVNVSTRAVGGQSAAPACVYALDSSVPGALSMTGNINFNASCGVVVDSNSSSALSASGNATVAATAFGVVGNYSANGNVKFLPTPRTHIAPLSDPLTSPQPPAVGTCTMANTTSSGTYTVGGNNQVVTVPVGVWSGGISIGGNNADVTFSAGTHGNGVSVNGNSGNVTFNPGQYQNGGGSGASIAIGGNASTTFVAGAYTFCGPLSIVGNNTVTLSSGVYYGGISISGNANVTFGAGTYVLGGGGLSVTGNSTLTGAGVTFYNTSSPGYAYAPVNLTGNERANFSAPTSGSLEGILFFQDRSVAVGSAGSTIKGNSSSTFDGVVYFPTTSLTYVGNSSSSGYTDLIADTITITGNASITINDNYSSLTNGSPIKSSALYE
jgi:hypothetical protein